MNENMCELSVYKSNAIIEASYHLTIPEQRILLACFAQIRQDEELTDEKMYEVSVNDLSELTDFSPYSLYKELQKAAESLFERKVYIYKEPNGEMKKKAPLVARWVQSVQYLEGLGTVRLRFTKEILPYINKKFSGFFTRYALTDVIKMETSHGIRFYELLYQYLSTGIREITVEQLREYLALGDKYPKLYDLKRWVIEPSIEQINKMTVIKVSYTQKKKGRSVHSFIFTIKAKKKEGVPINIEDKGKKAFKLTPTQAAMYANKLLVEPECQQLAYAGEETKPFLARLTVLLQTPEACEKLKHLLLKHGFNPKQQQHV